MTIYSVISNDPYIDDDTLPRFISTVDARHWVINHLDLSFNPQIAEV